MKIPSLVRLPALCKSGGVALVTAIFLLVVLAGLAVAIVSVTTSQQAGGIKDVQGLRAYQAAKAGVEWALYTALRSGPLPATYLSPATTLGCVASPTAVHSFSMPTGTTLAAFTVTVTCTAASAGIAGGTGTDPTTGHFRITSTACNEPVNKACPNANPGPDYVERSITAQL